MDTSASAPVNATRKARLGHAILLDEEHAILSEATPTLYKATAFAIDTGLRKEEQFSLLKSDIDLAKGVISVRPEITKTTRTRQVPLLPRSLEIAKYLLENVRGPYLFSSPATGKRCSEKSNTFYARRQRTRNRLGVPPVSWHDLRRTAGCRLLNVRKLSMHEVSLWLGHQSIQQTERTYAFLEQERLKEAVEAQTGAQSIIKKATND